MIRFTIGLSEQLNCLQRKAWDSNPHGACAPHGLANRPGEPYPATFQRANVVAISMDPMGVEPITPILQGSVAPTEHAGPLVTRVGVEPTESSGSRPDRFSDLRT